MAWFLLNWKEVALFSIIGGVLWLGYHLHTLEDKAAENATLKAQIENLQKGQAATVKFNQDYAKETSNVKNTDCIRQPMPAGIVKLLY